MHTIATNDTLSQLPSSRLKQGISNGGTTMCERPENPSERELRLLSDELAKAKENLLSHHQRLEPIRHQAPPMGHAPQDQKAAGEPVLSPLVATIRACRLQAEEIVILSNEIGQHLDI